MSKEYAYCGSELSLFAEALNWKRYYRSLVGPYLKGPQVLEVGAGIGEVARQLLREGMVFDRWLCLEPDQQMAFIIEKKIETGLLPPFCQVQAGFLSDVAPQEVFDTILYVDVLEHVEDDREEIERALTRLAPKGRLIIISPAHQWLYSRFDREVGHCRRYGPDSLKRLVSGKGHCMQVCFIDSVGFFASLANKLILKQGHPWRVQILFWDKVLVPLSRILDKILFYKFGKNIFAVFEKEG